MSYPIYLLGYSGLRAQRLLELVESVNGSLIDIRLVARSRVPEWNGGKLYKLFGDRYHHLPALGNVAYKTGGMQIADYAAGLEALRTIQKEREGPLFLMCACSDATVCHRTHVGELLRREPGGCGFEVSELALQP